jgi:hypothetical protein
VFSRGDQQIRPSRRPKKGIFTNPINKHHNPNQRMGKLLPATFALAFVSGASAAFPLVDHLHGAAVTRLGAMHSLGLVLPLLPAVAVPEPASNVLLICGLLTIGGLAIFLGKKLG